MSKENTAEQIAALEANERQAERESSWPVYEVHLVGDEVEWLPRENPEFWDLKFADEDDEDGTWVPKQGMKTSDNGMVVMPAEAIVQMHAPNEDYAKMLALSSEQVNGYHTVVSVRELNV